MDDLGYGRNYGGGGNLNDHSDPPTVLPDTELGLPQEDA